jgi:hypothetical protein
MPTLKGPQDQRNESTLPAPKPDPWSGPWGKINPSPQSSLTLRLCKGVSSSAEESFSYPYRSLSSWYWRRELQEEELKIEAGPDVITIRGKGLIRMVDALDAGALETVREGSGIMQSPLESTIVVASLLVKKMRQYHQETEVGTDGRRVKAE